jgi:Ca-activated chloride channel family protein
VAEGRRGARRASGEGARKVLLLTDGLANVGITDRASLVQMTASAATSKDVGTTTIGFGDDFDEELLLQMADAGRGNAHYAPTPEAAPGIFAKEFEDLVSLVAQNVSVEIRPSDEVQVLGILNEFPSVVVPGGVQFQLGDAFAEEHRRLVFELHVPSLASLGPATVAEVVLRYTSVGEQIAQHEVRVPLVVNLVSTDEAAAQTPDHVVVEEVVILKAARAQEQAREHADAGEFEQARKVLDEASTELRRLAPASAKARELLEQAEALESNRMSMDPMAYGPGSRKQMMFQARDSRQRRRR